eukprot:TRINITY_DN84296_c0_g1_i1.p1 TRINITY_DN84296_c0_g1~~TRINITY_DN84296_c0_g1_i1.p1  ORF type:complete len:198 (+),score=25.04 TRINITY_DN84296_c0_g1_i1:73-666(+)
MDIDVDPAYSSESQEDIYRWNWDRIGYKVVAKVGQRYLSVWAGDSSEYFLGVPSRDPARPNHGGGLYVCRTAAAAVQHRIPVNRGGLFMAPRVLLRCQCEGPFVEYPGRKIACSQITPLEVLPMPSGYLHSAPTSGTAFVRPLPRRPTSASAVSGRPSSAMRAETDALEAEVRELERRRNLMLPRAGSGRRTRSRGA